MERFRWPEQRMGTDARRVAAAAAILLAASAVAIGCGSSSKQSVRAQSEANRNVNTEQVEKGIESSLSTSSVKVTEATCPSKVPVQPGGTFTCSVKLSNGGAGKVTVTQQGIDRYSYAFAPGSVQIPGATADASIESRLAFLDREAGEDRVRESDPKNDRHDPEHSAHAIVGP